MSIYTNDTNTKTFITEIKNELPCYAITMEKGVTAALTCE